MVEPVNSCQEYFDTLSGRFIASHAEGVDASFVYDLTGDGGGTWTVTVSKGEVSVADGASDGAKVTYTMKAEDYVKMANGDLDGTKAFMTRKLKVKGSIPLAQKMKKFLPPRSKS